MASDIIDARVEVIERHAERSGQARGGVHAEVQRIQKVVNAACKECRIRGPYEVRKDNQRYDLHFDSNIGDKKETLVRRISELAGIKPEQVNVIQYFG